MDYPIYKYYKGYNPDNTHTFAVKFTGSTTGEVVFTDGKNYKVGHRDVCWAKHESVTWRDPSSPKEWLQLLDEPYGSLAVQRFEEQEETEGGKECKKWWGKINNIATAIDYSFIWNNTPEGRPFWQSVKCGEKPEIPATDHLIFVKESPGLSEICLSFAKKKGILLATEEGGPFICFNSQNKTLTCPKEARNTPVSLSEFIKILEELPDAPQEVKIDGFFGWREALIKPDGVVIGCQTISNEKLSKIYDAVSKIMAYEEKVELDRMALYVNSRGVHADGLVISFTEFAAKIAQIQAAQAKL